MATAGPLFVPAHVANDADFRTYVTAIHNALASLPDITQTADTGQINPATVARPGVNTYAGYEIWRFNDALQATYSVFFKIEYGVGPNQVRPALQITVGTASTGAGGIVGSSGIIAPLQLASTRGPGAQGIFVASSEPGRLTFTSNLDIADQSFSHHCHIERARDADGTIRGDVLVHVPSGITSGAYVISASGSGLGTSQVRQDARLLPQLSSTSAPGWTMTPSGLAVHAAMAYVGKPIYGVGLVAYNQTDIPLPLTTFTATVLGAARKYLTLGGSNLLTAPGSSATIFGGAAMRWE